MSEPVVVFLCVILFGSLPLVLIGRFIRSERSHQYINGREKISDLFAYTKIVGNSISGAGVVSLIIAFVFYLELVDLIAFAIGLIFASLIPIPYVIYAHNKYSINVVDDKS